MKRMACLLLLIVSLALTADALAATYYVDKNKGNDNNPGTSAEPFYSINRGVHGATPGSSLQPGDTLIVVGDPNVGTVYDEALAEGAFVGGTSESERVTLRADPIGKVTIQPPLTNPQATHVIKLNGHGQQYITIDGFILECINVSNDCLKAEDGASNNIIQSSELRNAFWQGILIAGGLNGESIHNIIRHNVVHDNGTRNPTGTLAHGMYVSTDANTIEYNTVYNNSGYGITLYNGNATESTDYNIVQANTVYGNETFNCAQAEIGVNKGTGNRVINNVVYNVCYADIQVQGNGNALSQTLVYNNTVDGGGRVGGIYVDNDSNIQYTRVKNNILTGPGAGINDCHSGFGTDCAANITNSDTGYFRFKDVGTHNYRLLSGSPAIDAGVRLTEVPTDFDGLSRPWPFLGRYDVGPLNTGHNRLEPGSSSR